MVDDSRSHVVMSSLMALINSGEQVHHVFEELASLVPLSYAIYTFYDDLVDDFTGISIDQDDPLVDDMTLGSILNVDSFKHFNGSDNIMKPRLRRLLSAVLVHKDEILHVSFDFSCHI